MNKEQFETLKERLQFGHFENSEEARNYRAITSDPIFYVQQVKRIYGVDPEYSHDHLKKEYVIDDESYESIEDMQDSGIEEVDIKDITICYSSAYWEDVCVHLTREAAEQYIKENRHNLAAPRIYTKSMNRCHELIGLVEAIATGKIAWKESE